MLHKSLKQTIDRILNLDGIDGELLDEVNDIKYNIDYWCPPKSGYEFQTQLKQAILNYINKSNNSNINEQLIKIVQGV